jgi:putative membrane protein
MQARHPRRRTRRKICSTAELETHHEAHPLCHCTRYRRRKRIGFRTRRPDGPADRPYCRDGESVDIDAGKLAESKGANKDVKAFGKQMVTDHTGVNKQATDLAKKLKVTPEDNPTSQALKKGGQENVAKLKGLSGAAFDKAYIEHEVAYHEQVLDAIDKTLIPNAKNAELKD